MVRNSAMASSARPGVQGVAQVDVGMPARSGLRRMAVRYSAIAYPACPRQQSDAKVAMCVRRDPV